MGEMKGRVRAWRAAGIQRPVRVCEAAGSAARRASLGSPEAEQPLTAPDGRRSLAAPVIERLKEHGRASAYRMDARWPDQTRLERKKQCH